MHNRSLATRFRLNGLGYTRSGVLVIVLLTFTVQAADFIVFSSLSQFSILNQYQEPASPSEIQTLPAYAPFRIEEADATLGDQITRAMKCSYDGRLWYILKDEDGKILGGRANAFRQIYRSCVVLDDTLETATSGTVRITLGADSDKSNVLAKGDKVVRVFRNGGRVYARKVDSQKKYGWLSGESGLRKPTVAAVVRDTLIERQTIERISQRIAEANTAYQTYFEHFNRVTGQKKSPPAWRTVQTTVPAPRWRLSAPYDRTGILDASTDILVRDLQNMLAGKPFTVEWSQGEIFVLRRVTQ